MVQTLEGKVTPARIKKLAQDTLRLIRYSTQHPEWDPGPWFDQVAYIRELADEHTKEHGSNHTSIRYAMSEAEKILDKFVEERDRDRERA